jgi:hypothetical protein
MWVSVTGFLCVINFPHPKICSSVQTVVLSVVKNSVTAVVLSNDDRILGGCEGSDGQIHN